MNTERFKQLEKIIDYKFNNIDLLVNALTHSSYANERKINKTATYERYEFLGDAILEFIVSDYLYKNFPEKSEGQLTKLRASLVCEFTLSQIAKELHFGSYVLLSRGEALTGGRDRSSIMCDLFESVLGAIYLDGGMENAKKFVNKFLLNDIETHSLFYDAKSTLQEMMQKQNKTFSYELMEERGPEHNKTFVSRVVIGNNLTAAGEGASIKASEQAAAYNALLLLREKRV